MNTFEHHSLYKLIELFKINNETFDFNHFKQLLYNMDSKLNIKEEDNMALIYYDEKYDNIEQINSDVLNNDFHINDELKNNILFNIKSILLFKTNIHSIQ